MSTFNRLTTRAMRTLGAAGAGRPVAYPAGETALLLVGVQRDLLESSPVVGRIEELIETARRAGTVVVHAPSAPPTPENGIRYPTPRQQELLAHGALTPGSPGAAAHRELAPAPGDVVLEPQAGVSAFAGGALGARLEELGRCRVVVAGSRTDVEVDSTARDAVELGLQVTIVADCCRGTGPVAHRSSLTTTLPRVVHRVVDLRRFRSTLH